NDIEELKETLFKAIKNQKKPVFIKVNSKIGFKSPKENSPKVHGEPLNSEEVDKTRENLGWVWKERFYIPDEIKYEFLRIKNEKINQRKDFDAKLKEYSKKYPKEYEKIMLFKNGIINNINLNDLNINEESLATRDSFGIVINYLSEKIENLISGSADLSPSTKSELKKYPQRTLHFGVREHLMAAFCSGVSLDGFLIPFCSTFLVFSDYMRPSIRVASIMNIPVFFVFSHDSIGVGEDGPTHQPIEHLMSLRLIPNLYVFRPADFFETKMALYTSLKLRKPTALIFTRQKVKNLHAYKEIIENNFDKGIYILENKNSNYLIIASGSEVGLALEVSRSFSLEGINFDVASAPSVEMFLMQNDDYKNMFRNYEKVFVIEAANSYGWSDVLGRMTICFDIKTFGESGKEKDLFEKFGFSVEKIKKDIKRVLF
ncbi:MAG: hypothetical protein N2Z20_02705, partial [Elusimicrobiales bacterium]|nr:hypothetical protein [Elusimicrobiales bacterium]